MVAIHRLTVIRNETAQAGAPNGALTGRFGAQRKICPVQQHADSNVSRVHGLPRPQSDYPLPGSAFYSRSRRRVALQCNCMLPERRDKPVVAVRCVQADPLPLA